MQRNDNHLYGSKQIGSLCDIPCNRLLNTLVDCSLIEDGQLVDLLSVEPRLCLGEVLEVNIHPARSLVLSIIYDEDMPLSC